MLDGSGFPKTMKAGSFISVWPVSRQKVGNVKNTIVVIN